jgi:hypothetical protein
VQKDRIGSWEISRQVTEAFPWDLECDRRHDKEVDRRDAVDVIAE